MNNRKAPPKTMAFPKFRTLVHEPLSTTTTTTPLHQAPSFHFGMPPNPMAKPLLSSYVYLRVGVGFFFLCSWKNMFCFFKVSLITKNKIMKWQKIDQKILSYVYVPTKYLVKYQNVNRFHFKN